MTPSQIEIELLMVGSATHDTLRVSQIIIQMLAAGYVPSMSIEISRVKLNLTPCQILRIRFVSLQSLISQSESATSSLTARSPAQGLIGSGASTQASTSTLTTAISVLRKKLTLIVSFFKYLWSGDQTMNDLKKALNSWARAFLVSVISMYAAGVEDPKALIAAGLASIIPPIMRYLDPKDELGRKWHKPSSFSFILPLL